MPSELNRQKKRLFKKIQQGKAVLFLGAGASIPAGLPSGKDLANMLAGEFLDERPQPNGDVMEVCSRILDTPGVNRVQLEDFLRLTLSCKPSPSHMTLCQMRWRAIFTTNFDELIESAYQTNLNRKQRCEPVYDSDFSRSQSDYFEILRVFRLMGTINGRDERSQMALSRADYNRKLRRRGHLFRTLYDFIRDGIIVYIGYSFQDLLARDLIDEVTDEVGLDRLPWSWAILPEWTSEVEALLHQRKIMPLQMTFEEFANELQNLEDESSGGTSSPDITLTLGGEQFEIDGPDSRMFLSQFDFPHDQSGTIEATRDNSATRRDYLEGKLDFWTGIVKGWTFHREILHDFKSKLDRILKRGKGGSVPLALLCGPAGCGKTTAARMIAHDCYVNGIPSIFLRPDKEQFDYLIVDSFYRTLERAHEQSVAESKADPKTVERLPLLVIIDEAAAKIQDIRRLPQYLASRGIPAVILAVARENEWEVVQGRFPLKIAEYFRLADEFFIDKVSCIDERKSLLEHLRAIGLIDRNADFAHWLRLISRDYENSFSGTLYYLIEPTRPPISQSYRNEYDRMVPLARRAYELVCLLYQFGVMIDRELLARSLRCSWDQFATSVFDPGSIGVIVECVVGSGMNERYSYRARSRLAAERIAEYAFNDDEERIRGLTTIASAVIPNNVNEVETIRSLLIHWIGPNGARPAFGLDGARRVFEALLDAGVRDSATLHHFGILLADGHEFSSSIDYLNDALAVLTEGNAQSHLRTESQQNIFNSLGVVYGKYAADEYNKGHSSKADELYNKATESFHRARAGGTYSAYPYYCEAMAHFIRAKNCTDAHRIRHIASALQALDESEGNIDESGTASIMEMEARIIQLCSGTPQFEAELERWVATNDPAAAYLMARLEGGGSEQLESRASQAYAIVDEALQQNPEHLGCLRLASRLHLLVYPNDWENWLTILKNRLEAEPEFGKNSVLFDLGYACCQLRNYRDAEKYFDQLEARTEGHPRRSGVMKKASDSGDPRRFTGIVQRLEGVSRGWLVCDVMDRKLKFSPMLQKFSTKEGQTVEFQLGLNYRGFLAVELRPV